VRCHLSVLVEDVSPAIVVEDDAPFETTSERRCSRGRPESATSLSASANVYAG